MASQPRGAASTTPPRHRSRKMGLFSCFNCAGTETKDADGSPPTSAPKVGQTQAVTNPRPTTTGPPGMTNGAPQKWVRTDLDIKLASKAKPASVKAPPLPAVISTPSSNQLRTPSDQGSSSRSASTAATGLAEVAANLGGTVAAADPDQAKNAASAGDLQQVFQQQPMAIHMLQQPLSMTQHDGGNGGVSAPIFVPRRNTFRVPVQETLVDSRTSDGSFVSAQNMSFPPSPSNGSVSCKHSESVNEATSGTTVAQAIRALLITNSTPTANATHTAATIGANFEPPSDTIISSAIGCLLLDVASANGSALPSQRDSPGDMNQQQTSQQIGSFNNVSQAQPLSTHNQEATRKGSRSIPSAPPNSCASREDLNSLVPAPTILGTAPLSGRPNGSSRSMTQVPNPAFVPGPMDVGDKATGLVARRTSNMQSLNSGQLPSLPPDLYKGTGQRQTGLGSDTTTATAASDATAPSFASSTAGSAPTFSGNAISVGGNTTAATIDDSSGISAAAAAAPAPNSAWAADEVGDDSAVRVVGGLMQGSDIAVVGNGNVAMPGGFNQVTAVARTPTDSTSVYRRLTGMFNHQPVPDLRLWMPTEPLPIPFLNPSTTTFVPPVEKLGLNGYWKKVPALSSKFPLPIDVLLNCGWVAKVAHESIEGILITETPTSLGIKAKLTLPGGFKGLYAESYPKSGEIATTYLRRDVRPGKTLSRMFVTATHEIIFKCESLNLWGGLDNTGYEVMKLQNGGTQLLCRMHVIAKNGKSAEQIFVGQLTDLPK